MSWIIRKITEKVKININNVQQIIETTDWRTREIIISSNKKASKRHLKRSFQTSFKKGLNYVNITNLVTTEIKDET